MAMVFLILNSRSSIYKHARANLNWTKTRIMITEFYKIKVWVYDHQSKNLRILQNKNALMFKTNFYFTPVIKLCIINPVVSCLTNRHIYSGKLGLNSE